MRIKFTVLVIMTILTGLGLFGCSTIEVSMDYKPGMDLTNLKTYAWKSDKQEKTGDLRVDSSLLDERIRYAVEQTLAPKGFVKATDESPDFHIRYAYSIAKRVSSTPSGTSVGFGFGGFGKYGMVGTLSGADVKDYDEALLIIDFLKPSSDTVLWRGKSTRTVYEHATPEEITRDINEAVEKMLAQFPPEN